MVTLKGPTPFHVKRGVLHSPLAHSVRRASRREIALWVRDTILKAVHGRWDGVWNGEGWRGEKTTINGTHFVHPPPPNGHLGGVICTCYFFPRAVWGHFCLSLSQFLLALWAEGSFRGGQKRDFGSSMRNFSKDLPVKKWTGGDIRKITGMPPPDIRGKKLRKKPNKNKNAISDYPLPNMGTTNRWPGTEWNNMPLWTHHWCCLWCKNLFGSLAESTLVKKRQGFSQKKLETLGWLWETGDCRGSVVQ